MTPRSLRPPAVLSLAYISVFGPLLASCSAQTPPAAPVSTGSNSALAVTAPKILLTPAMVTNETAFGNATALVDEQDLAGDPAHGQGGQPKTSWDAGWQKIYYPLHAFIDLGRPYDLQAAYLYDGAGTGNCTLATGTPFHWTDAFTDPLTNYNVWNAHPIGARTRYVRVTIAGPGINMPEVVLYGTPAGPAEAPPQITPIARAPRPTMDQFVGLNGFIDDPVKNLAVGGFEREYHNWNWDVAGDAGSAYPNDRNQWNPSYGAGGAWNFDDYYAQLKAAGITVCPDVEQSPDWMNGAGHGNDRPQAEGQDPESPKAYLAHADHMFQYAARYGATKVPDELLKLAPNQKRASGLDLLSYIENCNEADGWWRGLKGYSNPYELAAQCSADYDGDQGTLGKTFGVKNADPHIKLVLGGLAGLDLGYVESMRIWSVYNRGGSFPADVLNFHHYCNDGGEQGEGHVGISPEADHFEAKAKALIAYRDKYLPGLELWITEFGWDTNAASVQRAPACAPFSAEEVQGQWLVRTYLELAAAGVDRAAMFMSRDTDANSGARFATSGLTGAKGDWTPKPSWFYVHTLAKTLAGMTFNAEENSGNADVCEYSFRRATGTGGAYALWCPTSNNTTVPGFTLKLPPGTRGATLVEMTAGQPEGTRTPLAITGGSVIVAVSERPVFVVVDAP